MNDLEAIREANRAKSRKGRKIGETHLPRQMVPRPEPCSCEEVEWTKERIRDAAVLVARVHDNFDVPLLARDLLAQAYADLKDAAR